MAKFVADPFVRCHGLGFQFQMKLIGVGLFSCTRVFIRNRCPSADTT